MTAKEFRQSEKFTIRVTPRGMADKRDVDAFAYEYSQYVIKALKINVDLGSVSQAKRTVCPDCGDRGWLYDDEGRRIGICPCHY